MKALNVQYQIVRIEKSKGNNMLTISARIEEFIWVKLKERLKTKTNQDTVIKVVIEYNKLWKKNQDLELKLNAARMNLKTLKARGTN